MPFVKFGYHEGGRLVSLFAAIAAAALLGLVAYRLAGPTASLLSPALLWVHPWFVDMAFAYEPETLSIALTVAGVYTTLRFVDEDRDGWFVLSLVAVGLAITNHFWEATIGLPIVILLAHARRFRRVVTFTLAEIGFVALVWYIRGLQTDGSHLQYSIFDVGPLFLYPSWWVSHVSPHPVNLDITFTMIAGFGGFIISLWWVYKSRKRPAVLVAAWFASGLTIPFMLPGGFLPHQYYIWGLFAPLTLGLSIAGARILERVDVGQSVLTGKRQADDEQSKGIRRSAMVVVTVAVGAAIMYAFVFGYGVGATVVGPVDQATTPTVEQQTGVKQATFVDAGKRLREYNVAADDIVFVGPWGTGISDDGTRRFGTTSGASQVLIYGDVHVSARRFNKSGAPRVVTSGDPANCTLQIRLDGGNVQIKEC